MWTIDKVIGGPKTVDGTKRFKVKWSTDEVTWEPHATLKEDVPGEVEKYLEKCRQSIQLKTNGCTTKHCELCGLGPTKDLPCLPCQQCHAMTHLQCASKTANDGVVTCYNCLGDEEQEKMRENYVCPHTHDANQFRMATLNWEGIGKSCEKDCGTHWKKGKQVCSADNPGWLCKVQACKVARCNNCYGAEFCSKRTRRAGGGR